jgi:hypothetical protein
VHHPGSGIGAEVGYVAVEEFDVFADGGFAHDNTRAGARSWARTFLDDISNRARG